MESLTDRCYQQLIGLLADEAFEPDMRLPSEAVMSQRFGVSRPVLRQALERLRAEGRVYARKGAGNFVGVPDHPPGAIGFGPLRSVPDVRHFLEFRCSVEAEAAARAAERHDPAAVRRLKALRSRIERAVAAGEPGVDEDIGYHLGIAEASGNRFYTATLAALTEQTRYSVRLIRELTDRPIPTRIAEVHREHLAIEEAIASGDAAGAARAMRAHLRGGIRRLFGKNAPP